MDPARRIAVIILAAGRSSRMGASKPLLPLGSGSVIERVVGSVSRADIGDVIVVTGHDADTSAPVLAGLPVHPVYNADHASGMFSSVRTGVRALSKDVEAFFILPADYPLVRTEVLDRLVGQFRDGGRSVLHPSCCGVRGHPPLLSGRHRQLLLRTDDRDNLRSFLRRHREDEVEVEDLTILMDMDTPDDFRRIARFAGFIDAAADPSTHATAVDPSSSDHAPAEGRCAALTLDDALYLLALLKVPDPVVKHCRAVALVGEALAQTLKPHLPDMDVDLVCAACLLHDMARARPKHALVAQGILCNLGLTRLGAVVGAHTVLPPESLDSPLITEEQLVYLADKLVIEDRISSLAERAARTLLEHGQAPAAVEEAKARMRVAETIRDRVEAIIACPLEEVLA